MKFNDAREVNEERSVPSDGHENDAVPSDVMEKNSAREVDDKNSGRQ